ncbi:hypothetical protein GCM10011506_38120 [Marivirga lumbricoides]|uniref:RHS repeat-associated core domain-containing protein n=2 Tax=Marivirga lumbricoides TaxID=1046115 RepID=A0ABQ1MYA0_9BACT|nr:hypothetical protein GCM10011506_38120 [Marivirga lumbricoides]
MLKGEVPLSIKRAVFITENAFLEGNLQYEDFTNHIAFLTLLTNSLVDEGGLIYNKPDREQVLKSSSIYRVLKDSLTFTLPAKSKDSSARTFKKHPYTYDMDDFLGEDDWTKMFVTKLLVSNSGNCHSLPLLYKILAEEVGVPAYLSIAPNHTYIKQSNKKHGWYNTELTTGRFPHDKDIKWNSYIKTESVAKGIYMDTLSNKQTISYVITDLAQGYVKKFGINHLDTPLAWLETALEYYPNYVNALILKAELQKKKLEQEMINEGVKDFSKLEDQEMLQSFQELEQSYMAIHHLGYRKMPKEMYLNWLFRVNNDTTRKPHQFETPQPFEEYGYDVYIATAGDGQNYEFYDQDTIAKIGTVEISRMSGKIVKFVEYDLSEEMPDEVISRMYDPALGRFWQVDPMADARNWLTPYNFVQNNPITRVDPTGMLDDYFLDRETGEISFLRETEDDFDVLYAENSEGGVDESNSIQVEKDILNNPSKDDVETPTGTTETTTYTMLGDSKGQSIFEFVATNSNVEWGLTQAGEAGVRGINILSTGNKLASEPGSITAIKKIQGLNTPLRRHVHNHPSNTPYESEGDMKAWAKWSQANSIFQIFIPKTKKYITYPSTMMDEITVKPNKN